MVFCRPYCEACVLFQCLCLYGVCTAFVSVCDCVVCAVWCLCSVMCFGVLVLPFVWCLFVPFLCSRAGSVNLHVVPDGNSTPMLANRLTVHILTFILLTLL